MTDTIYGVIVLSVAFAAATLGAFIIPILVQIRDNLTSRAPAPAPVAPPACPRRPPARPIYPFDAALRAIPGAEVRPPLAGHSHGIIVATTDPAFIARVRAAMRAVPDVDVYLIAGIAPPDPQFDPHGIGRYLWGECWRDGQLLGREPRRRYPLSTLRHSQAHYWLIRPVAAGAPGDGAPALPGGDWLVGE